MDSGTGTATAGDVLDQSPQTKMPRGGAWSEHPPASPWAGLQPDALGVVLGLLPCSADRVRVRAVCRHWRANGSGHGVPPPLPLLVLPKFRLSSLSPGGTLTAPRQAWMPPEVVANDVRCVGSSDGWIICINRSDQCFMVNAFSHNVVHLPCLSASGYSPSVYSFPGATYSFHRVAISASPDSRSKCIVAAFGFRGSSPELALWKPGSTLWHVCQHTLIAGDVDITFYQGKLYMLWRFIPCLLAFELREDKTGVSVSRVQDCFLESLLVNPLRHDGELNCNIMVWRGKLLIIIRYYGGSQGRRNVLKVEVFALDLSTKPYGLTEIHSFGSDCVFVGSGGCKSFPAGLHDGVEGDLIYFVPDYYNPYPRDAFVYNMRDGAVSPFYVESSYVNCGYFPVWLFPSE